MSVFAMGKVGGRTAANALRQQSGSSAEDLLNTIGKYIPTDVTTAYVAFAGSMALAEVQPSAQFKLSVALAIAVVAAFAALIIAIKTARELKPDIGVGEVAKESWFELAAAPLAFLVWSAAMPSSWFDWGDVADFLPALVVTVTSLFFGGMAVILKRNT